jgi:hypothetical protein
LGLGSTEAKTQFALVESIGDKNIDKIFAGGSHSWIILNDIDPIRNNYRYPDALNDKSPDQIKKQKIFPEDDEEEKLDDPLIGTSDFSNGKLNMDSSDNLPAYLDTLSRNLSY